MCFFFSDSLYKNIWCGYTFEWHQQVDGIQMGAPNICLYKEVDKKYTGCNLKTTELLDCALIGVCVVIRSNRSTKHPRTGMCSIHLWHVNEPAHHLVVLETSSYNSDTPSLYPQSSFRWLLIKSPYQRKYMRSWFESCSAEGSALFHHCYFFPKWDKYGMKLIAWNTKKDDIFAVIHFNII